MTYFGLFGAPGCDSLFKASLLTGPVALWEAGPRVGVPSSAEEPDAQPSVLSSAYRFG